MAQLKATCEQIHVNESFHMQAPAVQGQQFAECLRELFASRMQLAADVKFFTSALQEQQKNLARLTQFTTLFAESGVLAHCDKGRASIRPTERDQCHPVTGFIAILLCPACATQAGNLAASASTAVGKWLCLACPLCASLSPAIPLARLDTRLDPLSLHPILPLTATACLSACLSLRLPMVLLT